MTKSEIPQMQLAEKKQTPPLSQVEEGKAPKLVEPSVALMLQKVIDGGITADNVSALESLVGLYDRMQAKNAEREFAAALIDLQGETSSVQATKAVDQKPDGTVRYRFAPYEEIMRTVKPILTRHGFSITFDTESNGDRLASICTLMHKSGHARQNRFAVRYGKPPGSSDAQGDMSTKSYAKRGALCDCLNIVVEHDDDARMLGQSIGQALAEDLRARVLGVGSNEDVFLKYAGVHIEPGIAPTFDDYAKISDERWSALDELLKRKEATKAAREKLSLDGEWK